MDEANAASKGICAQQVSEHAGILSVSCLVFQARDGDYHTTRSQALFLSSRVLDWAGRAFRIDAFKSEPAREVYIRTSEGVSGFEQEKVRGLCGNQSC